MEQTSTFPPSVSREVELFDEFFDSGMEDSVSPFITRSSRPWGKNLPLKASILAAFFLLGAFLSSFYGSPPLFALFLILSYFFAGVPALIASIEDLLNFEINIDVLMTLAAFGSVFIGSGAEGALLLVLFSFSGALEEAVTSKAKSSISALRKMAPSKALVLHPDGVLTEQSIRDISVGATILVRAGQIVPLDGKIVAGGSLVNLSHLTGEATPLSKSVGDPIEAGARTIDGSLTIDVERTSSDSTLARIIKLITEAQKAKPKLQRWIDRFSSRYATTIILLALFFSLSLPLFFSISYLGKEGSIYRSLAFLIAASPCALVIAIPIAYLSAIGACARKGIVLKGGTVLDALASCKTMALDKTGTLTTGALTCTAVITDAEDSLSEILSTAYALERNVVHPFASAICRYAEERKYTAGTIDAFSILPGEGIVGKEKGRSIWIGNPSLIVPKLTQQQAEKILGKIKNYQDSGQIFTIYYKEGDSPVFFLFEDMLRPNSAETISTLQDKHGMEVLMLTGDHRTSASKVAELCGINNFFAELKPEDKLVHIGTLAAERPLAMVGDGINDAPALSRATVGISMGKVGSTTAIDASDIILLNDTIESLGWLMNKARMTVRIVKQNITLALLAILFATLPALLGWIPLWVAVVLHEGGTVVVGLNALRLLKD